VHVKMRNQAHDNVPPKRRPPNGMVKTIPYEFVGCHEPPASAKTRARTAHSSEEHQRNGDPQDMNEKLLFDKTELVYRDMVGSREVMRNISYDRISGILVGTKINKKLFGLIKSVSEAVRITVAGLSEPLDIVKSEEGDEMYARYLEGLRKFAHDNHVTMRENEPGAKPFNAKEEWDGKK
jgi:hypothetical protein